MPTLRLSRSLPQCSPSPPCSPSPSTDGCMPSFRAQRTCQPTPSGVFRVSARRLLVDLAALGAFGLGGWLSLCWLLPAPDMAHALGVHLIRYGSTAALFWIAGRFL